MLIFRNLSVQASPKPKFFLENAEPGSRFHKTLELKEEAQIFCHVMALEDGTDPLGYYETELASGYCGIATVNQTYSEGEIYLYLPERQFGFFERAVLALGNEPREIRVTLTPDTDFKIVKRLRVHIIPENFGISFAPTEVK